MQAEIDRIAPSMRPAGLIAMHQRWAHLLFLHWRVDAAQIEALLPAGLKLDTYHGDAYVGLVPFTMTGVRPAWSPPVPGVSDFHETNVRTYVLHGSEPGVWFFSLDAANSLAVRVARSRWRLPYYRASMRLEVVPANPPGSSETTIEYESKRMWPQPTPAACAVKCAPLGDVRRAEPGSLEHFLVERYVLFTSNRGILYRGQVHHANYPLQDAAIYSFTENMIASAGIDRTGESPLAHYASEVNVDIYALRQVLAPPYTEQYAENRPWP